MKRKNFSNLSVFISFFGVYSSAMAANPVWKMPTPGPIVKSATTPNFEARQDYLELSPKGVGAKAIWDLAGGRGENVRIVDIESSVDDKHEDFPLFFGLENTTVDSSHGTAVSGIMVGKKNDIGITGIAHEAEFGFYGFIEGELSDVDAAYIAGITKSIRSALATLKEGDVLVMEQHMRGPEKGNWTAVEYWDEIFTELKAVTDRGIHCVAAAGNGGSNFDDPAYGGAFDITKRDSGCILVGAAGKDHERLYFSNYGSRVDVAGYGTGVTSTGVGDLFNGGRSREYTGSFNGTSSATPIVAGVVAVVSSIAEARGVKLSPKELRDALRKTGVLQGPRTATQNIGRFPNAPEIVKHLGLIK